MNAIVVKSKKWETCFDNGRNFRAKIGFVLIPNEQTIEEEMIKKAPSGVGVYFSRVMMPHEISTEALASCGDGLAEAASLILPNDQIDVVCYACTSGTVAIGEQRTLAELSKGAAYAKPTSLMGSVVNALNAIKAKKIVVGCPYTDSLATDVANFLLGKGFELLDVQGLNLLYDRDMIRVSPDFLVEFALSIDKPEADAILLSCGAIRSFEVIKEIEEKAGKPVICSNQAMLWNCLRLAGVNDNIQDGGFLFKNF
jgi:maleate isomerase